MDLIVWRHADAEDLSDGIAPPAITEIDFQADLARCLSSKGLRQAARMAQWLDRKLADMRASWSALRFAANKLWCPWGASTKSALNCPRAARWTTC